jgi:hypothetical protein
MELFVVGGLDLFGESDWTVGIFDNRDTAIQIAEELKNSAYAKENHFTYFVESPYKLNEIRE